MDTFNVLEFPRLIPDERTAETYFENIRWPEGKSNAPSADTTAFIPMETGSLRPIGAGNAANISP